MFDNLSKFLAQQYPEDFASWLVGQPIHLTELKPTELSLETIRADSVILLKSSDLIVHCEFQTDPDPDIGFRMADYALRIFRKYPNHRLIQIVVYLRPTTSSEVFKTTFEANQLTHQFQVVRLWEQPTAPFLQRPGLWPYAALTQTDNPAGVLREVARRIDTLSDRAQRSNLSAISAVMGGLSLEKEMIRRILRRDIMKESVIYQEWRQEIEDEVLDRVRRRDGLQGSAIYEEWRQEIEEEIIDRIRRRNSAEDASIYQEWRQEIEEEVEDRIRQEKRSIVNLLLTNKVGAVPETVQTRIDELSLEQLDRLAIAVLHLTSIAELERWLNENDR